MYDLKTDGLRDFRRIVKEHKVVREPLRGVIGSANRVFRTTYRPILEKPVTVYTSGSVPPSEYTVDYVGGVVEIATPPTVQPQMTYYWSEVSDDDAVGILFGAIDEAESRWPRNLMAVDSAGSTVLDPSVADAVYVVTSTGGSTPDILSQSSAEKAFFLLCAKYVWLLDKMTDSAVNSMMYRESRGVMVDKRSVPDNIRLALQSVDKSVNKAMRAAMAKYYQDGQHLGDGLKQPGTVEYFTEYEWQTSSRSQNYRGSYAGRK